VERQRLEGAFAVEAVAARNRSGAGGANFNKLGADAGIAIDEGHELAQTITDQFPNGGWLDGSGAENGDKCAWISSGQVASADITLSTGTFPSAITLEQRLQPRGVQTGGRERDACSDPLVVSTSRAGGTKEVCGVSYLLAPYLLDVVTRGCRHSHGSLLFLRSAAAGPLVLFGCETR
jgi:hypothetical protein